MADREQAAARGGLPMYFYGAARPAVAPAGFEVTALWSLDEWFETWQVRREHSGQFFALKRTRNDADENAPVRALLKNEFGAGRQTRSGYVIRALESAWDGPRPFVLLEWTDGTTLADRLADQGALPPRTAVWIARQVALGLTDLWRAGFVHGGIAAENIAVDERGGAKLIHLGNARRISRPEVAADETTRNTTAATGVANAALQRDIRGVGRVLAQMLLGLPHCVDEPSVLLARDFAHPKIRSLLEGLLTPAPAFDLKQLGRALIGAELALFDSEPASPPGHAVDAPAVRVA